MDEAAGAELGDVSAAPTFPMKSPAKTRGLAL